MGRKADRPLWRPHPRKPTTERVSQMHQYFASLEPSVSCRFWADAKSVSFASYVTDIVASGFQRRSRLSRALLPEPTISKTFGGQ